MEQDSPNCFVYSLPVLRLGPSESYLPTNGYIPDRRICHTKRVPSSDILGASASDGQLETDISAKQIPAGRSLSTASF